ncbi:MAG: FAD-binding protein [Angelakisella sp.]
MYDVVIIGLGPAGATLARLLDSRFQVACIDKKSDKADSFSKVCGGLISPDAQKALASFELTLPTSVLSSPQIFSVKTYDLTSHMIKNYQRFYINVNRHRFDRWLCSLIPTGVELYEDCRCSSVERTDSGYAVTFIKNGTPHTLHTRYVVGADGANSIVRKLLYPQKKIRSYLAIQQWFEDKNAKPFYSCVFDEKNTDCYSWSISKDNVFIFGGAYPKQGGRGRFEAQKKILEGYGIHFGEVIRTEACVVLRPSKPSDLCCGKDGAFLIGEAGGFISPSSLEGISSAINTAKSLAQVLNSGSEHPNNAYRRATLPLRMKLSLKIVKCPFMYFPPLRRAVMKSGIQTI